MSTTLLCIKLLFVLYVADRWRVTLKGEYPDYINAVFVNVSITAGTLRKVSVYKSCTSALTSVQGYKQQKAFIIAQGPMESTCRDFWKMIHDQQCGSIVMLSKLSEDGKVGDVCFNMMTS